MPMYSLKSTLVTVFYRHTFGNIKNIAVWYAVEDVRLGILNIKRNKIYKTKIYILIHSLKVIMHCHRPNEFIVRHVPDSELDRFLINIKKRRYSKKEQQSSISFIKAPELCGKL